MRKTVKKVVSMVMALSLILSILVVGTISASAKAAKGTIYYDFKEKTDVSQLTEGEQYMFLKASYGTKEAVVDIPDGSALLKYLGTDVDGEFYFTDQITGEQEEYLDDAFGGEMYYADGTKMADGVVDVIEAGQGFDGCLGGTIAFVNSNVIINLVKDGRTEYAYVNITKDEYMAQLDDEEKEYAQEEYEWLTEMYESDPDEAIMYLQYFGLSCSELPSYEEFESAYFDMYFQRAVLQCKPNVNSWWYGCNGGGVSFVGPFYLMTYKTAEFTADDINAYMKDGFSIPKTKTVVTPEQVVVSITIDGVEYDVPYYSISKDNNTLSTKDNDLTIDVMVGDVAKTVTVQPSRTTYADVPANDGSISNITQSDVVNDEERAAFNSNINNTEDELKAALEITDEQKAQGVNVWLEVEDISDQVPADEKKAVNEMLDKEFGNNAKAAMFINVDLFYKVKGQEAVQVHETKGLINISFVVPDEFINNDGNFDRHYFLVRVHDGKATLIEGTFDKDNKTLSFTSDKFSTYALVYTDVPVKEQEDIANTADLSDITPFLITMVATATGLAYVKNKKEEE